MLSYFLNRWIVARRFEKVDTGYVYRRRSDLPGIEVSADELRETLREFRRIYWRAWLKLFAVMLAVTTVLAIIGVALDLSENTMAFGSYGLVFVILLFVIWEQREWSALPEKLFADRPRVPSDVEPAGWFTRYHRLSRRRSWLVHAALIGVYGTISWLLAPRSLDAALAHWFFFGCFAFSLVLAIYGALSKVRKSTGC